jgi:MoaA/NifB/PqqE/SkfB family radical SAM enzyme
MVYQPTEDFDAALFLSSSGHCLLNCSYCVAKPVAKNESSLTFDDIQYLLNILGNKKTLLIFSGKGDFFTGYRKKDRLLSRLLDLNVEVVLDINGVITHEFKDLTEKQLGKIRSINLTMHYAAMKKNHFLRSWQRNTKNILKRKDGDTNFLLGFILSPDEQHIWSEALSFYEQNIYSETNKKITLLRDELATWDDVLNEDINRLQRKFKDSTEPLGEVTDFQQKLHAIDTVMCPAGRLYYRVWNDGTVQGCPVIEARRDAGNVKQRDVKFWDNDFHCNQAKYCDCVHIYKLGLMNEINLRATTLSPGKEEKQAWGKMFDKIKNYFG